MLLVKHVEITGYGWTENSIAFKTGKIVNRTLRAVDHVHAYSLMENGEMKDARGVLTSIFAKRGVRMT